MEIVSGPRFIKIDADTYNISENLEKTIALLEGLIEDKEVTLSDVHIDKLRNSLNEFTRFTKVPLKKDWDKIFSAIKEETPQSCQNCATNTQNIQQEFILLNKMIVEVGAKSTTMATDNTDNRRKRNSDDMGATEYMEGSAFLSEYKRLLQDKTLGVSSIYYDQPVLDLLRQISKLHDLPLVYYRISGRDPGKIEDFLLMRKLFYLVKANLEQGMDMTRNYRETVNRYAKEYYTLTPRAASECRKRKLPADLEEESSNKRIQPEISDCPQPTGITRLDTIVDNSLVGKDTHTEANTLPDQLNGDTNSGAVTSLPETTEALDKLDDYPTDETVIHHPTESYVTTHSTQKRAADTQSLLTKLANELKDRINQIDSRGLIGVINDLVEAIHDITSVFESGNLSDLNKLCNTDFSYRSIHQEKILVYTEQRRANVLEEIVFCGNIGCFQLKRKNKIIKVLQGGYCINSEKITEGLYKCIGSLDATGTQCQQAKTPSESCHFKYELNPKEQFQAINNHTALLDKRNNLIMQNLLDNTVQIMDKYTLGPKSDAFQLGFHSNFTFFLTKDEIDANFVDIVSYADRVQAWALYSGWRDYVLYSSFGLGLFSVGAFLAKIFMILFPWCRSNSTASVNRVEIHEESESYPLRANLSVPPAFRVVQWND